MTNGRFKHAGGMALPFSSLDCLSCVGGEMGTWVGVKGGVGMRRLSRAKCKGRTV